MICKMKTHQGDILVVTEGVILQQVNCQRVMGSGLARQIKNAYPMVYTEYCDFCDMTHEENLLNQILPVRVSDKLWVVNIFGQMRYGRQEIRYTSYDAVDYALTRTKLWLIENQIPSCQVHHPLLGCGLGGAEWSVVKALIETNLGTDTNLWVN